MNCNVAQLAEACKILTGAHDMTATAARRAAKELDLDEIKHEM